MTILETLSVQELGKKLNDPEIQDVLDFDLDLVLSQNSPGTSIKALKKLEPALSLAKLSGQTAVKYQGYVTQLKFAALPNLKQEEIEKLISLQLISTRLNGLDVAGQIRKLFTFPDASNFKKIDRILRSMEASNEIINNNLVFTDGKQYAGTVGNWIRLYKGSLDFGTGGAIGISNFLAKDNNIKTITDDQKEVLREILSIYEWVRLKAASSSSQQFDSQPDELNFTPSFGVSLTSKVDLGQPASRPATQVSGSQPPATSDFTREKTAFEKRLSEISGGPGAPKADHGEDLEALKKRLEIARPHRDVSAPLNLDPKKEIPTHVLPPPPKPAPDLNNPINAEIKREVKTSELPAHLVPKIEAPKPKPVSPPPAPKPIPVAPKPVPPLQKPAGIARPYIETPLPRDMALATLGNIKSIEDLKKIEPAHLRQAPIRNQTDLIKSKIVNLVKQNNVMSYVAVAAFEQSPLFKIYLQIGFLMMDDPNTDRNAAIVTAASKVGNNLTIDEFEAVADLKKQIEAM